jgi:hypothetical protein
VLSATAGIAQFGWKKHAKERQQFILAPEPQGFSKCVPSYAMIQVKLSRIKLD